MKETVFLFLFISVCRSLTSKRLSDLFKVTGVDLFSFFYKTLPVSVSKKRETISIKILRL